ncbi:MAG: hypothetical protein QOF95_413 [Pseudonocardiales bacterium]|nr:hypothetical protein [Pseudonocardiales bacterium]
MSEYSKHATITVTGKSWDESRVVQADPVHAVARATFTTTYAGDIEGESTCALLLSYVGGDPDKPETLVGPYVGYEQVTGTLDGRTGTFVLEARGEHSGGVATTEVRVVPDSGTGELAGLRGEGSYAADAMEYTMKLAYDFS